MAGPQSQNSRRESLDTERSTRQSFPEEVAANPTSGRPTSVLRRHNTTSIHDELSSLLRSHGTPYYNSTTASSPVHDRITRPSPRGYQSGPSSIRGFRNPSYKRVGSFASGLAQALGMDRPSWNKAQSLNDSGLLHADDERLWYDQFTSIDWVRDSIADSKHQTELRRRRDLRGRAVYLVYGAQGCVMAALVGVCFAVIAYIIVISESALFDLKFGQCDSGWLRTRKQCCQGATQCDQWRDWSQMISANESKSKMLKFAAYVLVMVTMAAASCVLTLFTRTVIPSSVSSTILNRDLPAHPLDEDTLEYLPPKTYYSASGSGVAEVRVILSGFILHGFLGIKVLVLKTVGLILSVASGLTVGKEGPYVHIATCVGNILCRLFPKYNNNDGKRREVLSASAASGVAIAFGAPISGVLFSMEEVSYYFPAKTLFRTFLCCIIGALTVKFFDPYGTSKIVLFQVHYTTDWRYFEILAFVFLGVFGGALGALFIKASRLWTLTFRKIPIVGTNPLVEVIVIALVSGALSFWNHLTRLPVAEVLSELANPCAAFEDVDEGLCPTIDGIPNTLKRLAWAFLIKSVLTIITFGIKVPAGIYVPSMVMGGLFGRMIGHVLQYVLSKHTPGMYFGQCSYDGNPESCVVPGVYALAAAGATMCGVTRLSVTLVVILFELTGSLDYVLPFSVAVLVSKWTADALEPLSIYDLLTETSGYPFLDQKYRPPMTGEIGDITPRLRSIRFIDIGISPLVDAAHLRRKLDYMYANGEVDGGLPIVRNGILIGLISGPDLEFELDRLESAEDTAQCLMTRLDSDQLDVFDDMDVRDFTALVDYSPISMDVHSSLDLVYECFVKLGLRHICVLKEGFYYGMVHKKAFVKYTADLKKHQGH